MEISLDQLMTFMFGDIEYTNQYFTKSLYDNQISKALHMIQHDKTLKLINTCNDDDGCNISIDSIIKKICVSSFRFEDVIKLLKHLSSGNIICDVFVFNITTYCSYCIDKEYIENAKAIYIMFNVDNMELLRNFYSCDDNDDKTYQFEISHDIISQCQDIIPVERRGIPSLDIVDLRHSYDIMEYYYTLNPQVYTKAKITEVMRMLTMSEREYAFYAFFSGLHDYKNDCFRCLDDTSNPGDMLCKICLSLQI